ncbi:3184_t:CDS:2, partial [Ambispora leptoticha]
LAAVVLDPRHKLEYFEALGWSSRLITQIRDIISDKYEIKYASVQDIVDTIKESSETNILSRIYKRLRIGKQSELDIYLFVPSVDSSVPSEQVFSISGDMVTNKRNRLS